MGTRILMIAPQPFLEERGAPFAIFQHIRALIAMGFEIDLVTYHIGQTVRLPGLRIFRIPSIPGIREVKVGPSLAKLPLGFLVFCLAFWRQCREQYPYLHTHEEAGMMGILLSALFGSKHLYYMHSDLPQQMVSSGFITKPWLSRVMRSIQTFMVRKADSIIAICPDISKSAHAMAPNKPIYMIENCAIDENLPVPDQFEVERLRQELQIGDGPIILYTGTLEPYQGLDLLLHSIAAVQRIFTTVRYLIVGGQPGQVEELRQLSCELGIEQAICFRGRRPLIEMPLYMSLADILVSPRSKGTNTPLKLYTYLRSGKPILATAIYSQTQVLSPEISKLVAPTSAGLAQGALDLLRNPQQARALGKRGKRFAHEHYGWPVFFERCWQVQQEFAKEVFRTPHLWDENVLEEEKACAV